MEVLNALGVRHGAGGVAELHVRALLGGLQNVGLMAEGVGEDEVAAFVDQVERSFVALVGLRNVALDDDLVLGETQGRNGLVDAVDEVQVVGGILVVQQDDTQLDAVNLSHSGKGGQAQSQRQNQSKKLLHGNFLLK